VELHTKGAITTAALIPPYLTQALIDESTFHCVLQQVTKDRIYSLAFHPYVSAEGKAIVCAGDKGGQLGMYAFPVPGFTANLSPARDDDDEAPKQEQVVKKVKRIAKRRNRPQPAKVMEVEKNEDEEAEEEEKKEMDKGEEDPEAGHAVSVYQPHSRVISGIVFSPVDHNKLYTSSYDGSLRCMDVDKNAFDLVYAAPAEELLTRVDISGTGHELYFVTSRGDMKRRDLRKSEKKKVDVYSLHEKKAYCVHINRSNENQIVTSSGYAYIVHPRGMLRRMRLYSQCIPYITHIQ
jgi:predicted transcriptional regulator